MKTIQRILCLTALILMTMKGLWAQGQPTQANPSAQGTPAQSVTERHLPAEHGQTRVTARIDTSHITIGGHTMLHIRVEGSGNRELIFQTPEQMTLGPVEALESVMDTTRDGKTIKAIEQTVTITSFDSGAHRIAWLAVGVQDGGGYALIAPGEDLVLTVDYAEGADTTNIELKKDSEHINEPYTFWEIVRWAVLGLVLAALIALLVLAVKRHKANKPIVVLPKSKPIPADRKALAELEALRRKELWQKGRIKKYYTDMTDIVRRFLHNMYGMPAGEMTTRQTLRAFHGISDWSEENELLLKELLDKADMVKFAKSEPEAHEHDLAMEQAVKFVKGMSETHRLNNPEEGGERK